MPESAVLVTRRFWPLVGSAGRLMAELAVGLAARDWHVTLLTARWDPCWPTRITYRGVPVVRLAPHPKGSWGTIRYTRSLARWLRRNQDSCDVVYVSALRHEASAAIRVVGNRVPVVLRAEGTGRLGDCIWQLQTVGGRRIKRECMKAAAYVASGRSEERELQAAGYPRRRIYSLPHGVQIPPPPSPGGRAQARSALTRAVGAVETPGWAPMAVYAGRLTADRGLRFAIEAWKAIVARRANARLWLAGEGPERAQLQEQIAALELTGRVILPGVFDDVHELLCAADLYILPCLEAAASLSLLEAMAAGLPIVAGDTAATGELLRDGQEGLLVAPGDSAALSAAISRLLDEPDWAAGLGAAARKKVAEEFPLATMIDRHVALFQRLIQERSGSALG